VCVNLPQILYVVDHKYLEALLKLFEIHVEFAIVCDREIWDLLSEGLCPTDVIVMERTIICPIHTMRVSYAY
jgi:hypothetical protein